MAGLTTASPSADRTGASTRSLAREVVEPQRDVRRITDLIGRIGVKPVGHPVRILVGGDAGGQGREALQAVAIAADLVRGKAS